MKIVVLSLESEPLIYKTLKQDFDADVEVFNGFTNVECNEKKKYFSEYSTYLKNSIFGIAYSHLSIWLKLLEDKDNDGYVVFEDDVILTPNEIPLFSHFFPILKELPCDLFLFGYCTITKNIYEICNEIGIFKIKSFYGMHAYYINKNGASKILDIILSKEKINGHIDRFLTNLAKIDEILVYCVSLEDRIHQKSGNLQCESAVASNITYPCFITYPSSFINVDTNFNLAYILKTPNYVINGYEFTIITLIWMFIGFLATFLFKSWILATLFFLFLISFDFIFYFKNFCKIQNIIFVDYLFFIFTFLFFNFVFV